MEIRIIVQFLENAYNCEICSAFLGFWFLLSEEWKTDSCLSRPTITTSLDNALKLQSTRKTICIPSQNYSKQRSLRRWPARSPFLFPASLRPSSLLFLRSLTCFWNAFSKRVYGPGLLWKLVLGKIPLKFLIKLAAIFAMLIRHRWHFWRLIT